MRKLYLAVASCGALVALIGFSASAIAAETHDPACDEWGNEVGLFAFDIDMPDSDWAYAVSSVKGVGYACGSSIDSGGQGAETLYNHADIGVPAGVDIADSDLVPSGSWAGTAVVNILYHAIGFPIFTSDVPSSVTTDDKAECEREMAEEIVGDTPQGEIVSCLYASNILGHNWNWSVRDAATGKLSLTIGPMHGILGIEPGLTKVDLELCGYYGDVGVEECGTDGQYQQINGDPSVAKDPFASCGSGNGNGTYTITATMEDGTVTPESKTCVRWKAPFVGGVKRENIDAPNVNQPPPTVKPPRVKKRIDEPGPLGEPGPIPEP